ncbi:hypothetical protein Tco_1226687 [Tanacetum coccineum]
MASNNDRIEYLKTMLGQLQDGFPVVRFNNRGLLVVGLITRGLFVVGFMTARVSCDHVWGSKRVFGVLVFEIKGYMELTVSSKRIRFGRFSKLVLMQGFFGSQVLEVQKVSRIFLSLALQGIRQELD